MDTSDRSADGVIVLSDVRFSWSARNPPLLDIGNLRLARGERVFVSGPSGSGKSTLLNLLTGVLTPQRGAVQVLGCDLATLCASARDRFRADHVGYIFQLFNLIPYLSVIENVWLPCRFSARRRARALAHSPGLESETGINADAVIAKGEEFLSKQQALANATNPKLNGALIRMPGHMLPLEFSGKKVIEFLLVPWVGACIHTPPPPPNQIVRVERY